MSQTKRSWVTKGANGVLYHFEKDENGRTRRLKSSKSMPREEEEEQKEKKQKTSSAKKPKKETCSAKSSFQQLVDHVKNFPLSNVCAGWEGMMLRWLCYLIKTSSKEAQVCVPTIQDATAYAPADLMIVGNNDDMKDVTIRGAGRLRQAVDECNHDIVVVHISLISKKGGGNHSNLLIINKKLKTYQIFEPHGQYYLTSATTNFAYTYQVFTGGQFAKEAKFQDYTFVSNDECPMLSVQKYVDPHLDKNFCKETGGGYCLVFSALVAHMLLMCPNSSQADIENAILDTSNHEETQTFMRRYMSWIESVVPQPKDGKAALQKFDKKYYFIQTTGKDIAIELNRLIKEVWTQLDEEKDSLITKLQECSGEKNMRKQTAHTMKHCQSIIQSLALVQEQMEYVNDEIAKYHQRLKV